MSSVADILRSKRERREKEKDNAPYTIVSVGRPKTLREPDRDTFYCDVRTARFSVGCCKILDSYPNGDMRILTPNGVQFTARAEEVFYIRKGDWHEAHDLS